MPIIKWEPLLEPFEDIDRFFEDFLPSRQTKGFTPAVDVYQTKDSVVVKTPLAGVDPQDVEVSIENDVLTIKGETKQESEVDEKDYYRREIRQGKFYRSVALPFHVVGDKAKAESSDGMLKITIPKAPEVKAKKVKISVKKSGKN